eukprot:CAMPEP_0195640448 /NCGR_PEP_ID=MMETSP0815-20121206/26157_1 /TAXON_ID=97485 /ORGANISM="Prymnesium parvum, Strain Texoma1" /LENGTH=182 /DNA_ID=CAMNT_0040783123 /DNA_START=432 /DNA_END=980 /DNA_ORIENTATION=+
MKEGSPADRLWSSRCSTNCFIAASHVRRVPAGSVVLQARAHQLPVDVRHRLCALAPPAVARPPLAQRRGVHQLLPAPPLPQPRRPAHGRAAVEPVRLGRLHAVAAAGHGDVGSACDDAIPLLSVLPRAQTPLQARGHEGGGKEDQPQEEPREAADLLHLWRGEEHALPLGGGAAAAAQQGWV